MKFEDNSLSTEWTLLNTELGLLLPKTIGSYTAPDKTTALDIKTRLFDNLNTFFKTECDKTISKDLLIEFFEVKFFNIGEYELWSKTKSYLLNFETNVVNDVGNSGATK